MKSSPYAGGSTTLRPRTRVEQPCESRRGRRRTHLGASSVPTTRRSGFTRTHSIPRLTPVETNALYYGDNLNILRDFIPDESVDLIYLDPPFNSNRNYNLIFKDQSGNSGDAQILAFEDTWRWGPDASAQYEYLTNTARHHGRVPNGVSQIVAALRSGIGTNEMMAYLVEMTVRLVELHRVLKATGSLYLHCDPTASHYLKLLLDGVFGPTHFLNEIVWKRSAAHSDTGQGALHLGRTHDVLLFYAKGDKPTRNLVVTPFSDEYISSHYGNVEAGTGRRFRKDNLTAAKPGGDTLYEWTAPDGRVVRPYPGRYWAYSRAKMEEFSKAGRLVYTKSGMPEYKRYLDEMPGRPVQDIWDDIPPVNSQAKERLGWATQKPLALLERVISISSNPGDIVLDPFCGCGTALVAAQKLGREWVGIDVTYLSIAVMKNRLAGAFGVEAPIIGAPTEVEGARALAEQSLQGRYQFQQWALTLVDAAPAGPAMPKKGADSGIDGRLTFTDVGGQLRTVIVSVKSGGVNRAMVGDLAGVVQGEGAAMGLFITLEEPTKPMLLEAAKAGEFYSELSKRSYPKIQILTIRELLDGRKAEIPLLVLPAYSQAEPVEKASPGQVEMFG
jgi:DNA modification methylase